MFAALLAVMARALRRLRRRARQVRADIDAEPQRRSLQLAQALPAPVDVPAARGPYGGVRFRFADEAGERADYYLPVRRFRQAVEFLQRHGGRAITLGFRPHTHIVVGMEAGTDRVDLGGSAHS